MGVFSYIHPYQLSHLLMYRFQNNMVFLLFYKYFGDPNSAKAINRIDYIQLIIAAKRILLSGGITMNSAKKIMNQKNKAENKEDVVVKPASSMNTLGSTGESGSSISHGVCAVCNNKCIILVIMRLYALCHGKPVRIKDIGTVDIKQL